jgi:tRNA(Ile)-lysidine synthase TilS/MesJ
MCKLCETNPVYEFANQRKLCKNCFIYWFNKKFLYTLRKYEMIKSEDKIAYENKGDFRGIVLEENLKQFGNRARIELIKNTKKYDKIALSSSLDQESYLFVKSLIENKLSKINDLLPKNKKEIRPLYLFLDKEIKLYAELKKLKYKKTKEKKSEWENFIDKLEESHPEIKQAIIQSYLKIAGRGKKVEGRE